MLGSGSSRPDRGEVERGEIDHVEVEVVALGDDGGEPVGDDGAEAAVAGAADDKGEAEGGSVVFMREDRTASSSLEVKALFA